MTIRIIPPYFVCMCDFGRRGFEAVVDPELTRQNVIDRIKSGEYQNIQFIHYVDGLIVEDVTDDLLDDAEGELQVEARNRADQLAFERDRARKVA